MQKRGVALVPTLIVVFAVLLILMVVVLFMQQKGIKQFDRSITGNQDQFNSCFCQVPGSGNVCADTPPTGYTELPKPATCDEWKGCDYSCYKKEIPK